jgi:transposase
MREIVNPIFYVLRGGIPWRMLPPCFAPHQTVYGWFAAWRDADVWQAINHHLVMQDRERVGREASPSAAVIDSQSVKTIEAGGPPRRWVVEQFFAWLNRNRRLAKDFEATIASATAFLYAACVMLLARWLAFSG